MSWSNIKLLLVCFNLTTLQFGQSQWLYIYNEVYDGPVYSDLHLEMNKGT